MEEKIEKKETLIRVGEDEKRQLREKHTININHINEQMKGKEAEPKISQKELKNAKNSLEVNKKEMIDVKHLEAAKRRIKGIEDESQKHKKKINTYETHETTLRSIIEGDTIEILTLQKRIDELEMMVDNHKKINCDILQSKVVQSREDSNETLVISTPTSDQKWEKEKEEYNTIVDDLKNEIEKLKNINPHGSIDSSSRNVIDDLKKKVAEKNKEVNNLKQIQTNSNKILKERETKLMEATESAHIYKEELQRERLCRDGKVKLTEDNVRIGELKSSSDEIRSDENIPNREPVTTDEEIQTEPEDQETGTQDEANKICKIEFLQRGSCHRGQCNKNHNINFSKEGVFY